MDNFFYTTHHDLCNWIFKPGLELTHVLKRGQREIWRWGLCHRRSISNEDSIWWRPSYYVIDSHDTSMVCCCSFCRRRFNKTMVNNFCLCIRRGSWRDNVWPSLTFYDGPFLFLRESHWECYCNKTNLQHIRNWGKGILDLQRHNGNDSHCSEWHIYWYNAHTHTQIYIYIYILFIAKLKFSSEAVKINFIAHRFNAYSYTVIRNEKSSLVIKVLLFISIMANIYIKYI